MRNHREFQLQSRPSIPGRPHFLLRAIATSCLLLPLGVVVQSTASLAHPQPRAFVTTPGQRQPSPRRQPAFGQSSQLYSQQQSRRRRRVKFVPPAVSFERGAPGNRGHNASRSGGAFSLTALIPQYLDVSNPDASESKSQVWSLTASPQPVFWAHIPVKPDTTAKSLQFVLRNQAGERLYKSNLPLPQQSGIVRIAPEDMPALEPGKAYQWFIKYKVQDDKSNQMTRDHDEGWVEYRPSQLSTQGKSLTEQAELYAQAGYWHEALDALAQQRQANPEDATLLADWEGLLADIQLEELAQEPLQ